MKKLLHAILTLAIISPVFSALSFANDKAVYGDDDRMELYKASPETARLADSVASIWFSYDVPYDPDSKTFSLRTMPLAEKDKLCPKERFRTQPAGESTCSGALVGDDLVLTAGHCVTNQPKCNNIKIVFGFAIKKSGGEATTVIAEENVYSCKKWLSANPGGEGELDYALIQLDRKVTGHKPLEINRDRNIKNGDRVLAIGNPSGLPLKIAEGSVRNASPNVYFVTDLDTFKGSSGAPVFNTATRLIEGILVRGGDDLRETPAECFTTATYPQDGGRGEDVTRISAIESLIPKFTKESNSMEMSFQAVNTTLPAPEPAADGLSKRFSSAFQRMISRYIP